MKWVCYFVWCLFGKPVTVVSRSHRFMLFATRPAGILWTTATIFGDTLQVAPDVWDGAVPPAGGKQLTADHEGLFWVKGWLISPRRRRALLASVALLS